MTFVVFFELNPRFVINEEANTAEEARDQVSKKFGLDPKFLEAVEKKGKK